jgi:hypothetical protein
MFLDGFLKQAFSTASPWNSTSNCEDRFFVTKTRSCFLLSGCCCVREMFASICEFDLKQLSVFQEDKGHEEKIWKKRSQQREYVLPHAEAFEQ